MKESKSCIMEMLAEAKNDCKFKEQLEKLFELYIKYNLKVLDLTSNERNVETFQHLYISKEKHKKEDILHEQYWGSMKTLYSRIKKFNEEIYVIVINYKFFDINFSILKEFLIKYSKKILTV